MESAEARRKRLKALSQSAVDAGEGGGLGPAGGGMGALANPFADEGGTATNSGPFNFYSDPVGAMQRSRDVQQQRRAAVASAAQEAAKNAPRPPIGPPGPQWQQPGGAQWQQPGGGPPGRGMPLPPPQQQQQQQFAYQQQQQPRPHGGPWPGQPRPPPQHMPFPAPAPGPGQWQPRPGPVGPPPGQFQQGPLGAPPPGHFQQGPPGAPPPPPGYFQPGPAPALGAPRPMGQPAPPQRPMGPTPPAALQHPMGPPAGQPQRGSGPRAPLPDQQQLYQGQPQLPQQYGGAARELGSGRGGRGGGGRQQQQQQSGGGRGGRGGRGGIGASSGGIEAYVNPSMLENPWEALERQLLGPDPSQHRQQQQPGGSRPALGAQHEGRMSLEGAADRPWH